MAGPIARTQPDPTARPEERGPSQPLVSRQFDDAPAAELTSSPATPASPSAAAAAGDAAAPAEEAPAAGLGGDVHAGTRAGASTSSA